MTDQQNNTMYKFIKGGKEILVGREVWCWEAYYNDGTVLKQFDDTNNVFHQFAEIDQEKLVAFKMVSDSFPQKYVVPFNSDTMKLIHFYRNFGFELGTPQFRKVRWYCFGYELKNVEKQRKYLMVIIPEGEVIMCESMDVLDLKTVA